MSKLSARLAGHKKNIGLSLAGSQKELILERAEKLNEEFNKSQIDNFHNKYFLDEAKKLGEG